jgi:hypothetical protein
LRRPVLVLLEESFAMPYTAPISRANPTALIFLLDQSGSMREPFAGQPDKSKADGVSDALNRLLQNLILKCARADGVRDFFRVGLIGYGGSVTSVFDRGLLGSDLVLVSRLASNPLRIEMRTRKVRNAAGELVAEQFRFPSGSRRGRAARRPCARPCGRPNSAWRALWPPTRTVTPPSS